MKLNVTADFEAKDTYSIRIEGTNPESQKLAKALTVSVTNVEEAPTDLTLDNAIISENGAANAVIGSLTLADPDTSSTSTDPVIITEDWVRNSGNLNQRILARHRL